MDDEPRHSNRAISIQNCMFTAEVVTDSNLPKPGEFSPALAVGISPPPTVRDLRFDPMRIGRAALVKLGLVQGLANSRLPLSKVFVTGALSCPSSESVSGPAK